MSAKTRQVSHDAQMHQPIMKNGDKRSTKTHNEMNGFQNGFDLQNGTMHVDNRQQNTQLNGISPNYRVPSSQKQQTNHNERNGHVEKAGNNNKTLIINQWPNYVDTTELKNNLKNCSCSKTIAVDLIKCSCHKILEIGLCEFNQKQGAAKHQPNPLIANRTKKCAETRESLTPESTSSNELDLEDSRAKFENFFINNDEHTLSVVNRNSNTDGSIKVQIGEDLKYDDIISMTHQNDLLQKKKLKVYFKIQHPKNDSATYGPVTKIDLKMDKLASSGDGYHHHSKYSNNENTNMNSSNVYDEDNYSYRIKKEGKKSTAVCRPVKKLAVILPEPTSSCDDFHSIRDYDNESMNRSSNASFEMLDRNNNAHSEQYIDNNPSSSQSKRITRGSANVGHPTIPQVVPVHQSDPVLDSSVTSSQPNLPDNSVSQIAEEKPQKLTLNAQIKLKIYQNEQGEIAVQQLPATRMSSKINVNLGGTSSTHLRTEYDENRLFVGSEVIGPNKSSSTKLFVHNDKVSQEKIEQYERDGYLHNPSNTFRKDSNANTNTNNNKSYVTETKNVYIRQKKMSAINNNILYYEEKEMQMSETSTVISEQDMNEYNNANKYYINHKPARSIQRGQHQRFIVNNRLEALRSSPEYAESDTASCATNEEYDNSSYIRQTPKHK
jgi:hypothetical protein